MQGTRTNHNRLPKSPQNEIKSDRRKISGGKPKGKCFSFLNMLLIKLLYNVMPFEFPICFCFLFKQMLALLS